MKIGTMFLKVRVIISESFVQKYQSQEQLLNLETQSDVFFGPPCIINVEIITFCMTVSTPLDACNGLPEINRLKTETNFPILPDTVIEIKCDHPWFYLDGDKQITCNRERTFGYVNTPSCIKGQFIL